MNEIKIPPYVSAVMKVLRDAGFEAFVVGGCVRDTLLGREPSDFDVTTSCPPDALCPIYELAGFTVIPTGLKHGTVTVVVGKKPVEVTTYRSDGVYTNHRAPDEVVFETSIERDLERRDFTINAMAYSDESGLVDLHGGVADLERRSIRCVGDPSERFTEDALRIMRALRFSSTLGFAIENSTKKAIYEKRPLLAYVSAERLTAELSGVLTGRGAMWIFLEFYEVMCQIMPMISEFDLLTSASILNGIGDAPLHMRLAAFLAGSPDVRAEGFFKLFRFDKKTRARAMMLLAHMNDDTSDRAALKRLCRDIGYDSAYEAVRFNAAVRKDTSGVGVALLEDIGRSGECYTLAALDIDGSAVTALGVAPKNVGGMLSRLLDAVMDGKVENKREALVDAARQMM